MSSLKVSVIIRTKNEAKDIEKNLKLIIAQSLSPHEIIVVDSGSTDGTIDIVKQFKDVKLILMPASEFTFGRSLNLGFKAATGDILVSISAHAFPCDMDWLINLTKAFENSNVAGVYGQQTPQPDAWPPVKRDYQSYYSDIPRVQSDPNIASDRTFSNANSAIRKNYWETRTFDEYLTAAEDHEWAWSMLMLGHQIVYEPKASVYHSHNENFRKLAHRSYRETLAINKLYQQEISLYRGLYNWCRWIIADFKFIVDTKQDWQWILKSPFYRAYEAYGCLKASSLNALLKIGTPPNPI